ncbi:hypothetical protein [Jiangella anatolica]|uniref:Uncharacterized protein n=1 Tax=Jiangella anatolica TaxID=2670374 RepID=A0A2W2C8K6_9ACTN|nr:hypothetical protein [Jiangella anatolica]PZF82106.1 hypothetical protein C1I92_18005 [Jiangella anatolica]
MHDQLTAWSTGRFGEPRWYKDPGRLLSDRGRQDVAEARRRATARGRIAHHEPIHNRPLREQHVAAMTAANWICPVSAGWMAGLSSVPQVLERRPGPA